MISIPSRTLIRAGRGLLLCGLGAALLALGPVGCESSAPGMMAQVPPGEGWAESIAERRAAKDLQFGEDPSSPLLADDMEGFQGLEYWDPDPAYYFVGPVNYHYQPKRFTIVTTTGQERPCEKIGWVGFEINGQAHKLQVYRLLDSEPPPGDPGFFLPFNDGTTGKESYPAGRYIDLQGPVGGPYVLDFNTAYNPWCAYGSPERFICPVTPAENRLDARIEAGERGYLGEGG